MFTKKTFWQRKTNKNRVFWESVDSLILDKFVYDLPDSLFCDTIIIIIIIIITARIGLVSHQRTHQHTRTYSRNNDGLSHK